MKSTGQSINITFGINVLRDMSPQIHLRPAPHLPPNPYPSPPKASGVPGASSPPPHILPDSQEAHKRGPQSAVPRGQRVSPEPPPPPPPPPDCTGAYQLCLSPL
ncbi:unnamed protein product [Arctogadus glacialis]